MHPLFSRPARLLLYLLGCLACALLLAPVFASSGPRPYSQAIAFIAPIAIVYGLVCLSAWWVCRAYPVSRTPPWKVVLVQLAAAVLAAIAWALLGAGWAALLKRLFAAPLPGDALSRDLTVLFAAGVPLYLLSAVVHYLFVAVWDYHAAQRRVLESQVHAREAELRALRAQLSPHFLFNSLNSINALIGPDPEGARRMCEGLGDFLRLTLRLGGRDSVTLAEELTLVDRYLAIERVRFGERLQVERRIDPAALACLLPPLLLQPLVENAVKHGIAGRIEPGTLRLEATRHEGRLVVSLENPVDVEEPQRPGTGTGIGNVRRRLAALGEHDAHLAITPGPGLFRVVLALPASENPPGGET
jgi:two-component system, LytTR family, sensor histidine kinase AlgZ